MKRMLLTALAASMLALFAPAVASARHGHHHRGHARTHKGHAKTSQLLRFGSASVLSPSGTTTPIVKPEIEKAGTVESFTGGVLTIKLNDESKVSGKVTEETKLRCVSTTPEPSDNDDDQGGGDDQGGSAGDEHGGSSDAGRFGSQHGDFMAHRADNQGGGDDENQSDNDDDSQESCTTAALVPGAVVLAAELKLTSTGAVWEQVDLAK